MTAKGDDAGPSGRVRLGQLAATLIGLLVAGWVIHAVGWTSVAEAGRRLGVAGFALYCLYSLGVFGVLGAAWVAAAPGERWHAVPRFTWARLVREAVADLLPFAQLGGLVVGARVLQAAGRPRARVWASMIVDLSTEMASQLVFTVFGLALIASTLFGDGAAAVRPLVIGGTALTAALIVALLLAQRRVLAFAAGIARRVVPRVADTLAAVDRELRRTYARRDRVVLATLLNLAGWLASAAGAWLLLRLAGRPLSIWSVFALESLIFTVRSVAFAVPAAIGLQEAAYVIVGPLVGLSADAALALSMGKRARELCLSVPTLVVWWLGHLRAAAGHGKRS